MNQELQYKMTSLVKYHISDTKKGKIAKISFAVNLYEEVKCFLEHGIEYNESSDLMKLDKKVFRDIPLLTDLFNIHLGDDITLNTRIEKAEIRFIDLGNDTIPILNYVSVVNADEFLNTWLFENLGLVIGNIVLVPLQMTMPSLPKCSACGCMLGKPKEIDGKMERICTKCGTVSEEK